MSRKTGQIFLFEKFRLDAERFSLWREGELISIPPKALQLLLLLIEKEGEIVSREELLETVWQNTFVEEANINYTISLLRKSLGNSKLVQTVPKRGYRIACAIRRIEPEYVSVAEIDPVLRENEKREVIEDSRPKRWVLAAGLFFCLLALGGFGLYSLRYDVPENISLPQRNIRTLAILPFKNLNTDESDQDISLGLTDALISRIGSLKRIIVRPFSAVEKFSKGKKDSLEFGRELKCDAVLVGTFQNVDNHLRVNVRLLDVRDGEQVWTTAFDETESDLFRLRDSLSFNVAGALLEHLTGSEEKLLGKDYTENPEAYRAYLRGRVIFDRRVDGGFQQGLDEYQKAVSLDPTFALAYAGLADLFSRRGNGLSGKEATESYKLAKVYAQKALELDGDLAEGYASMGRIRRIADWDWVGAEKDFKHAIELDPNNATALSWYAQMLSFCGRHDEALTTAKRAIEIDPVSPSVTGVIFPVLEGRAEFDEGLRLLEEAYTFDKENTNSRRAYATFLYHKGEYGKSIEVLEESIEKGKIAKHASFSLLAAAYQKTARPDLAADYLSQIESESKQNTKFLYSMAINYAELGRFDEAISALESCYEQREERLVWMNNEPRFGELRNDVRFRALARKIGVIRE